MNCDELRKLLPEYFDNSLERKDAREFERQLDKCPEVKLQLAKLKRLREKLEKLPLSFDPPKEIINDLTERLMELEERESKAEELTPKEKKRRKKEKAKLEKEKKKFKKKHKDSIFITRTVHGKKRFNLDAGSLAIILLIIFIGVMVYYFGYHRSSTEPWKIKARNTSYSINDKPSTAQNLFIEDKIRLEKNSEEIRLLIKGEAEITLYPDTELTVVEAEERNNIVNLNKGKLLFNNLTIPPNFILLHKRMVVSDKQSKFLLEVTENDDVVIDVMQGFIEVEVQGDRIFVSNDYFCTIKNATSIQIPYHRKASEKLKSSLEYLQSNKQDVGAVSTALLEAGEFDALSLLRLIEIVPPSSREIIYQKIKNLYPPPDDVTKEGILNLNEEMLEDWWYEIEWQF